jgi:hypothetical protein
MLETLFIWGLIVVPLGIAVVLILYRARFFVVGILGMVAIMMLIWAGLRFAAMFDGVPDGEPPATLSGSTTQLDRAAPTSDVRSVLA